MTEEFHLAQANIAYMRAPMDDPVMADFVARIEALNKLADEASGFVWRLDADEGDDACVALFSGAHVLFNLSVWESVEALEAYVYQSDHIQAVRKRAEWFERPARSPLVLWWIDAGHIPTQQEAEQRFELLWKNGPTEDAFTFRKRFEIAPRCLA